MSGRMERKGSKRKKNQGVPLRPAQSDMKLRVKREEPKKKGHLKIKGKTTRSHTRGKDRIGKKRQEERRHPKSETEESEEEETGEQEKAIYEIKSIHEGLKGETLKDWAARIEELGAGGLTAEFNTLKRQLPMHPSENWEKNGAKNRYKDVRCWDYTRVRLSDGQEGDYIHGNYVDGYKRARQFICTQGPLDTTLEDFWRMVWQERCLVIVMLTRLVEMEKIKCGTYYAEEEGQQIQVGDFQIRTGSLSHDPVSENEKLLVRDILLSHKGQKREIKHIHYADWPDRGVPSSAAQFICILAIIHQYQVKEARRNHLDPTKSPILVHCSAGIGRTGTLVAVDVCREHLRKSGKINVQQVVQRLREQRANSVQTDSQYIFIHRAIIEWSIMMHRVKFNYDKFFRNP